MCAQSVPLFATPCTDGELKVGTRTDYFPSVITTLGLLRWCRDEESAFQCRRHKRCGFVPWVRKIPCSRKWQSAPVFLPGKFHGQRSLEDYRVLRVTRELDTTKQLSAHIHTLPHCGRIDGMPPKISCSYVN